MKKSADKKLEDLKILDLFEYLGVPDYISLYDKNGFCIFNADTSDGSWDRCEMNENGWEVFFENSDARWGEYKRDEEGKILEFNNCVGLSHDSEGVLCTLRDFSYELRHLIKDFYTDGKYFEKQKKKNKKLVKKYTKKLKKLDDSDEKLKDEIETQLSIAKYALEYIDAAQERFFDRMTGYDESKKISDLVDKMFSEKFIKNPLDKE
jgi:hypothetical protein